MKIRENCYMLGLGSTGGKIYKEFVQRHYKGAAANGSEQDHKALGDVPNKYILQPLKVEISVFHTNYAVSWIFWIFPMPDFWRRNSSLFYQQQTRILPVPYTL